MDFKDLLNEAKYKKGTRITWNSSDGDKHIATIDSVQKVLGVQKYKLVNLNFNGKDTDGFDMRPVAFIDKSAKLIKESTTVNEALMQKNLMLKQIKPQVLKQFKDSTFSIIAALGDYGFKDNQTKQLLNELIDTEFSNYI